MSESSPTPFEHTTVRLVEDGDRFGVLVRPLPNGESRLVLVASVEGVTHAEVVHHLAKALTALTGSPLAGIPTEAQLAVQARREKVAAEHPARHIFTKTLDNGAERDLFLSDAAVEEVGADLTAREWARRRCPARFGSVPCDYTLDPAAFRSEFLTPLPADPPPPPPPGEGTAPTAPG